GAAVRSDDAAAHPSSARRRGVRALRGTVSRAAAHGAGRGSAHAPPRRAAFVRRLERDRDRRPARGAGPRRAHGMPARPARADGAPHAARGGDARTDRRPDGGAARDDRRPPGGRPRGALHDPPPRAALSAAGVPHGVLAGVDVYSADFASCSSPGRIALKKAFRRTPPTACQTLTFGFSSGPDSRVFVAICCRNWFRKIVATPAVTAARTFPPNAFGGPSSAGIATSAKIGFTYPSISPRVTASSE